MRNTNCGQRLVNFDFSRHTVAHATAGHRALFPVRVFHPFCSKTGLGESRFMVSWGVPRASTRPASARHNAHIRGPSRLPSRPLARALWVLYLYTVETPGRLRPGFLVTASEGRGAGNTPSSGRDTTTHGKQQATSDESKRTSPHPNADGRDDPPGAHEGGVTAHPSVRTNSARNR